MVEFINGITGTQMWVADERVEEYKAAGHKLAAISSKAAEPTKEPVEKVAKPTVKETVKKVVKKTTKATTKK